MLHLENVSKRFGAIQAVDRVTLHVQRGEMFGLLGPNGAGKSTLIHIMIGLLPPDAGSVNVNGRGAPTHASVRRNIGLAPQALAIYEELTAAENLHFLGRMYGMGGAALRQRVREVLMMVGLTDRARSRVDTYSGGMKRRLNLAAALLHDPEMLLLDEPTVGVDPQSRSAIFDLLLELRRQGRTVVYTTHYMEEAQRLCERVAIIDHGRVLALDTVSGLIRAHGGDSRLRIERRAGVEEVLTSRPLDLLANLVGDNEVLGLQVERANLESVFLNLTGRSLRDS